MNPIRVVIAVDHPRIRESLCRFLAADPRIQITAQATDGLCALKTVQTTRPDLLLIDLDLHCLDGLEVTRILHRVARRPRILILGLENTLAFVEEVLLSGADGYVLKDEAHECLLRAVLGLMQGEKGWLRPDRPGQRRGIALPHPAAV